MSHTILKSQKSPIFQEGTAPDEHLATSQEDNARLITAHDGKIIFSDIAFYELCGARNNLEGRYIQDILTLSSDSNKISEDGEHHVVMQDSGKELSLQFNWIETQSQKYLVVSAKAISAGEKLLHYVAEKIKEKHNLDLDETPFFGLSFDACSLTDENGHFIHVNQNFLSLFGLNDQSIKGLSFTDLIHPNSKEHYTQTIIDLENKNQNDYNVSSELCCIGNNEQPIWIEWNCKRIDNRIYSASRDVTALKEHHQALNRQQKKLSEAEAIGQIGQWEWPVGSDFINFSEQLFEIFGLDNSSFTPTLDNINAMIHRQDSGRMMQVFQRAIIEQNDYDMDFRITRPDGEIRFIQCEGRCETDAEDDVIALYGIMRDVTDVTKRETDLKQAKESVERAYAAKTQFLANMSHELRTPLNAIIGFSEMIERQLLGPIGTEKYLEYISGIRESGEHLLDLISDILDMSKIEAGKYELHSEQFNIAKVIRMAAHMMEGRALDSDIKIKIEISDENLSIFADRRAVMQMTLNLLSNAVKFSKNGKTVIIRLIEGQQFVRIEIEDQGIGIPANKLANITMPFEQAETDYTREYEGTGLGLSITKELAEIHGGHLDIESQLDIGTKVTIRLPYETFNEVG